MGSPLNYPLLGLSQKGTDNSKGLKSNSKRSTVKQSRIPAFRHLALSPAPGATALVISLAMAFHSLVLSNQPPGDVPAPILTAYRQAEAEISRALEVSAGKVDRRWVALEQIDPKHYQRLKREWAAFQQLPPEKQKRIRQLDYELFQQDRATQIRLLAVMERYVLWLEGLSPDKRRRIGEAPVGPQRLAVVRELRQEEWLDRQPAAIRKQVLELPVANRAARIAELRQKQREERLRWQRVLYPIRLPGPASGPMRYRDLPQQVRERLSMKEMTSTQHKRLKQATGKWPDYAITFTEIAREKGIRLPKQLGPSRAEEFSSLLREFIEDALLPRLSPEERDRLAKEEGFWPQYPQAILELALRYDLTLPDSSLPDLPEHTLRNFALSELTPKELADLQLSPQDRAASREKLTRKYFEKHPEMLERLLQSEHSRSHRRGRGRDKAE